MKTYHKIIIGDSRWMKETGSKIKEDRVRAHPFVTADDFYDEEKYEELLRNAAEEVLG